MSLSSLAGLGLALLGKFQGLIFGAPHFDLSFDEAALGDREKSGLDVSPHFCRGPELDVLGGEDISFQLTPEDNVRTFDFSLDLSRFFNPDQSFATDIPYDLP